MNTARIHEGDILHNLINLPQLVFEVTDDCNLNCYYCTYGQLYCGYDERCSRYLNIHDVKPLIEYLAKLWTKSLPEAKTPVTHIGFYGGEPMLNMSFVKEVITFFDSLHIQRRFKYSMTTNAMLLDRHMDYLVEKDFALMISLDGDRFAHSYRVDKAGRESYNQVIENIKRLESCYPDYFKKSVNFNAVLHNRNGVQSATDFIYTSFGKKPRLSELVSIGVRNEKKEEFESIFLSKSQDFKSISESDPVLGRIFLDNPMIYRSTLYVKNESGNVFKTYNDLLVEKERVHHLPTGTCSPFSIKMFVTVNGKILPCEKIPQRYSFGSINDGILQLDLEAIAKKHNEYLDKVRGQCDKCSRRQSCIQCVFTIEDLASEDCHCAGFMTKEEYSSFCQQSLNYLKQRPSLYKTLITGTEQL